MAFRILLAAGIVICLGLNWALQPDPGRPGLLFLPEMFDSPAYPTLSANPHFADGKTVQLPAAGTIARGHLPLHFEATPEDALRAGEVLANPLTDDRDTLRAGESVFRTFCAVCHGQAGLGDGPVVQRGVPAPPSLIAEQAKGLPDGQLFHIVTRGKGNMPGYASQVTQEERWQVILYIRSLQLSDQPQ